MATLSINRTARSSEPFPYSPHHIHNANEYGKVRPPAILKQMKKLDAFDEIAVMVDKNYIQLLPKEREEVVLSIFKAIFSDEIAYYVGKKFREANEASDDGQI